MNRSWRALLAALLALTLVAAGCSPTRIDGPLQTPIPPADPASPDPEIDGPVPSP
jgi:hypothetical protein